MKKLAVLLFAVIIAVSSSVCAFAVSSPTGQEKEDKYVVSGTVKQNDKVVDGASVSIDNGAAVTTDDKGTYRIENITAGSHKLVVTKGDVTGTVTFVIQKGTETKYVQNADGTYTISVLQGVTTIDISLALDAQNKVTISNVNASGNASPDSPQTSDVAGYVLAIVLAVSGAAAFSFSRKAFSL